MVQAIAFPLWILFFDVTPTPALLMVGGVALLAAIGFTAVGTLFSAMSVRTRFAELLLPVLLLPFMIPPVFFAAQLTMRLLTDRPASELFGGIGHRVSLIGADRAAIELDPADAAVQCLDDTQQPRAGRGAYGGGHRAFVQGADRLRGKGASRAKARYYACFVRRHEKSARRNGMFRGI